MGHDGSIATDRWIGLKPKTYCGNHGFSHFWRANVRFSCVFRWFRADFPLVFLLFPLVFSWFSKDLKTSFLVQVEASDREGRPLNVLDWYISLHTYISKYIHHNVLLDANYIQLDVVCTDGVGALKDFSIKPLQTNWVLVAHQPTAPPVARSIDGIDISLSVANSLVCAILLCGSQLLRVRSSKIMTLKLT